MILNGQLLPGVPASARYHLAGTPASGPVGVPTRLRSMAEYHRVFGPRTPAAGALYDDLYVFFTEGGAEAWLTRVADGAGPAEHVAALEAGAVGRDGAAVAVPQLSAEVVGEALMGHAAARNRIALLTVGAEADDRRAAAAAAALTGAPGSSSAALLWPWVRCPDGMGVVRSAPPTGFAAAARARAHATAGFWAHPAGPASAARRLTSLAFPCDPARAWALGDDLVTAVASTSHGVCLWGWWSLSEDRANYPHLTSRELVNGTATVLTARYTALGAGSWSTIAKFTSQVRAATKATCAALAKAGALTPTPEGTDLLAADDGYRYSVDPDYEAGVVRVDVALRPVQYARMVSTTLVHVPVDVPMPYVPTRGGGL